MDVHSRKTAGRLLQQLERCVLSGGVHGLGLVEDVDLARGLVRQHDGVGGQGADLVDGDGRLLLPLVVGQSRDTDDVRVNPGLDLPTVAAAAAGPFSRTAAHRGGGEPARLVQRRFARGGADQTGMGQSAVLACSAQHHAHPAFRHSIKIFYPKTGGKSIKRRRSRDRNRKKKEENRKNLLDNRAISAILKSQLNTPYQERWRERPCEARQPAKAWCQIRR